MPLLAIVFSLCPVSLLLLGLTLIGTYRLVRPGQVFAALAAGGGAALAAWGIQRELLALGLSGDLLIRGVAPLVEELLKGIWPLFLLCRGRLGFAGDAALHGFAVGAGFSLVENLVYLALLPQGNPAVWLVRGLGASLLHGGATAVMAILARAWLERRPDRRRTAAAAGLLAAITLHAAFNQFPLAPLSMAALNVLTWPLLLMLVYAHSDRATRQWLDLGLSSDAELHSMLTGRGFLSTPLGRRLASLRDQYPGETVADMLCYLRLLTELSIRAKGRLLLQEAGLPPPRDPDLKEKLSELAYLRRSIGPSGCWLLHSLVGIGPRQLWQLNLPEG